MYVYPWQWSLSKQQQQQQLQQQLQQLVSAFVTRSTKQHLVQMRPSLPRVSFLFRSTTTTLHLVLAASISGLRSTDRARACATASALTVGKHDFVAFHHHSTPTSSLSLSLCAVKQ
jgi:hypothetical protein